MIAHDVTHDPAPQRASIGFEHHWPAFDWKAAFPKTDGGYTYLTKGKATADHVILSQGAAFDPNAFSHVNARRNIGFLDGAPTRETILLCGPKSELHVDAAIEPASHSILVGTNGVRLRVDENTRTVARRPAYRVVDAGTQWSGLVERVCDAYAAWDPFGALWRMLKSADAAMWHA